MKTMKAEMITKFLCSLVSALLFWSGIVYIVAYFIKPELVNPDFGGWVMSIIAIIMGAGIEFCIVNE